MKSKALLLPFLLVLLLAVVFQSTREREDEASPAATRAVPASEDRTARTPPPRMEWNHAADEISAGLPGGRVDESTDFGRLLKEIEAMTGQELVAAHQELAGTDLPQEARARFETVLIGTLVRKDPELALHHFADHLRDPSGETGTMLMVGFREWAAKSPTRAERWLDSRVQEGALDSHDQGIPPRVLYERELIRGLLAMRPDRADSRLEALPEQWRGTALKGTDTLHSQGTYAALVRKFLPEADQEAEFINMAAAARYREGATGVAALLDRIAATPAERERILRHVQTGSEQPAQDR